jgi:nucleotide-binding universal stress UspA family protein
VLIAVDSSDVSEHAAAVARRLFGDAAEYVLVNVSSASGPGEPHGAADEPPVGDPLVTAHVGTPAAPGDDSRELLDVVAARAHLDEPRELAATGDVVETIVQTAAAEGADVIVAGAHDRSWFSRLFTRSTSRHLTAASDVPVLLVKRTGVPHGDGPLRVVVGTDGSPPSLLSARTSASLFGDDAHYEVVHVAPPRPDPNADATGFAGPLLTEEEADELERESLVKGSAAVADTARSIGRIAVTETVLVGDPVLALCGRASEAGADVLVIGATGASRLMHVLLGSVSARVIDHADVPVLVVPHPAA